MTHTTTAPRPLTDEQRREADAKREAERIERAATISPDIREWTNPRTGEVRRYINNVGEIFQGRGYDMGRGKSAYVDEAGNLVSDWKYIVNAPIRASLRAHGIEVQG